MKIVKGNLITLSKEGCFDVIVHGCNCFCCMGAGIAPQIKKAFPSAYKADENTLYGSSKKLGLYSSADVKIETGTTLTVINAYTQYGFESASKPINYEALRNVFNTIGIIFRNCKIGYPKIGAGLAGGDWNKISEIINQELMNCDHTLVEYDLC